MADRRDKLATAIDLRLADLWAEVFEVKPDTIDPELLGWFLVLGLRFLLFAIFIIFWIIGGIKAFGGQWYKLPIIGEFAWKTVNQ